MKKIFWACMVAAFFISSWAAAAEIGNSGYIEVEHISYPEQGESLNATQRIAEVMARRALAEQIGELHINSSTTVKQFIDSRELSDEVVTKVERVLQGSKVTVTRQPDGSFHAVARLPVFGGKSSLAEAVLPEVPFEEFPKPKFTNIETESYTGLIVDCSGQELATAVAPAIKSVSGEEIYAYKNVSRQLAVSRGLVAYSDSLESGVRRAGVNPLTVQAMFIEGDCDVVVSDEDADRILNANQKSKFLNNCMIVFVR